MPNSCKKVFDKVLRSRSNDTEIGIMTWPAMFAIILYGKLQYCKGPLKYEMD